MQLAKAPNLPRRQLPLRADPPPCAPRRRARREMEGRATTALPATRSHVPEAAWRRRRCEPLVDQLRERRAAAVLRGRPYVPVPERPIPPPAAERVRDVDEPRIPSEQPARSEV